MGVLTQSKQYLMIFLEVKVEKSMNLVDGIKKLPFEVIGNILGGVLTVGINLTQHQSSIL